MLLRASTSTSATSRQAPTTPLTMFQQPSTSASAPSRPRLACAALVVTIAAPLFATACRSERPSSSGRTGSVVADAKPSRGGELVASLRTEPATYNRFVDHSTAGEALALLTQAPLVSVNRATDTLEPWLAESWTESADRPDLHHQAAPGRSSSRTARRSRQPTSCSRFARSTTRRSTSPLAADTLVDGKPLQVEAPDPSTVDHPAAVAVRAGAAADRQHPDPPAPQARTRARGRNLQRRVVRQDPAHRDRRSRSFRARRARAGPAARVHAQSALLAQGRRRVAAPVSRQADRADRARPEHRSAAGCSRARSI